MNDDDVSEVELLRSVYRHLDRDGLLAEHPSLSLNELDGFFRRWVERLPSEKEKPAESSEPDRDVILYTDGGSRGNPGPAGFGAVLLDRSGNVIAELSEFIGRATSNEAEYNGLIKGLQAAREHGAARILIRADSELMVRQINGAYKVKSSRLRPLFQRAKGLIEAFASWRIEHIPRERNARADDLANQAMDRARR